eukprot:6461628-Amphidinium_carterae.1
MTLFPSVSDFLLLRATVFSSSRDCFVQELRALCQPVEDSWCMAARDSSSLRVLGRSVKLCWILSKFTCTLGFTDPRTAAELYISG